MVPKFKESPTCPLFCLRQWMSNHPASLMKSIVTAQPQYLFSSLPSLRLDFTVICLNLSNLFVLTPIICVILFSTIARIHPEPIWEEEGIQIEINFLTRSGYCILSKATAFILLFCVSKYTVLLKWHHGPQTRKLLMLWSGKSLVQILFASSSWSIFGQPTCWLIKSSALGDKMSVYFTSLF